MRDEDADLVLALEENAFVDGVRELEAAPTGWPRLIVVLREDTVYALGTVTGLIVRALPHRDRSHVGVAAEERLRELWNPLAARLALTPDERAAAHERARARERDEAAARALLGTQTREAEPPPASIPVLGPFVRGLVWTLSDRRVVVLEVVANPFRHPLTQDAPEREGALVLIVANDDEPYEALRKLTPDGTTLRCVAGVQLALDAIEQERPARIVCSESLALGDGGLLDRVEALHPELLPRFEILCAPDSADWLASYLASRMKGRVRVLEAPLTEEEITDLLERAKAEVSNR